MAVDYAYMVAATVALAFGGYDPINDKPLPIDARNLAACLEASFNGGADYLCLDVVADGRATILKLNRNGLVSFVGPDDIDQLASNERRILARWMETNGYQNKPLGKRGKK